MTTIVEEVSVWTQAVVTNLKEITRIRLEAQ
jgi:hypothetical protein